VTTDTIGDTVRMTISGGERESETRSMQEEFRIGALKGQPEYSFTSVSFVAVASDSSFYLLETRPPAIRLYDARGVFVRPYGREGQGPEEYSPSSNGIIAGANDELILYDYGNQRVAIWSRDGAQHRAWPSAAVGVGPIPSPAGLAVDYRGHLLLRANFQLSAADSALVGRPSGPGLLRRAMDGTVIDTVRVPRLDRWPKGSISAGDPAHRVTRLMPPTPYSRAYMFAWSPLGFLVTGESDSYTLELHRTDEPPVRVQRLMAPVAVSADEHVDLTMRAEYATLAGASRARSLGIQEPPPRPPVPTQKQFITTFHIARDGRIWVRVSQTGVKERLDSAAATQPGPVFTDGSVKPPPPPEFAWPEPNMYEVFEADGRYMGRVLLPRGAELRAAYGERVWAVVKDEMDIPYIARYRVSPAFDNPK
jgi:hypothetical protein